MWLIVLLISLESRAEKLGQPVGDSYHQEMSSGIDQQEACRELKTGESRIVDLERDQSPTGVPARYKIDRIGDKDFKITLNVLMGAEPDETEPAVAKARTAKVQNLANECFNEFNSTFKDKTGRRITFDVRINDRSVANTIPYNPIFVTDKRLRESHETLSIHSTCSTMTHEFMHLLGLCDLYHETLLKAPPGTGFEPSQLMYNCRIVARNPNRIMANGILETIPLIPRNARDAMRVLAPAEMNAVLYNGCLSKNRNYYRCAKMAYLTAPKGRCPEIPDECKSDKWLDEVSQ